MRRRWLFLLIPIATLIVVVVCFEMRHRLTFGDFFGFGVHTHVLRQPADIGIPGISSEYALDAFNYTAFPIVVKGCKVPTDISPYYEIIYRYEIQRWAPNANTWISLISLKPDDCPQDRLISDTLQPGKSIRIVDWEATAAREGFRIGDSARFIAYALFDKDDSATGQIAFISKAFTIDEQPADTSIQYRIKH